MPISDLKAEDGHSIVGLEEAAWKDTHEKGTVVGM